MSSSAGSPWCDCNSFHTHFMPLVRQAPVYIRIYLHNISRKLWWGLVEVCILSTQLVLRMHKSNFGDFQC